MTAPSFTRVQGSDGTWHLRCEEIHAFLDEFLAGELAADRRAEFERHLAACRSCAAYLATYRTAVELARGAHRELVRETVAPPELIAAILAARS